MCLIKGFTEEFRNNDLSSIQSWVFVVVAISVGLVQLKTLNSPMELFDQVDNMPIYQSSLILLNIAAGAIVMQEAKLYKWWEFLLVVLCALISVLGVYVIVKKPKLTKEVVEDNTES